MDHRIQETFAAEVAKVKVSDPEKLLMECKDGICKMISEHIEETYDITKKDGAPVVVPPEGEEAPVVVPEGPQEEEPGLFSVDDEPEEEG